MIQSVCVLGRLPALGLAELESLYSASAVSSVSPQVAGLTLHAHDVDFKRLGGSTRLAHVLAELPTTDWKRIERELPDLLVELALTLPDGKIQLGLSAFGLKVSPAKLNAAALTLKKAIRGRTERSVRVIPNPELELNTAQVLHNHLTGPTGIELLLIAGSNGRTVIARTVHVQDIDSYTLRDRGRPKRDARVGMLPPKLAQIIINLAVEQKVQQAKVKKLRLLDPFCGTGVVLQEAQLMGYDVHGTDFDPRMIEYSAKNLEWLRALHPEGLTSSQLEVGDATTTQWVHTESYLDINGDIQDEDSPLNPDFVACETYLGRPFTSRPNREVLEQTVSEVNLILKKFLQNIHGQLASGTRLCLAVPAWNLEPKSEVAKYRSIGGNAAKPPGVDTSGFGIRFKHLPLIDQISDLGYNRIRFEHVREEQLLYYREDQYTARELLVLTRT